MNYLTDAHALLWHLFARKRLGAAARAAFDNTDIGNAHISIPVLVLAEVIQVVQKSRLPGVTVPQLLAHVQLLKQSVNYTLLGLVPNTVIASHALTAIPDIFDRLIVAEAQQLRLPLITRDATISAAGSVPVVWD
jgi:PIN domain nuclease of toxin-antitoxin system